MLEEPSDSVAAPSRTGSAALAALFAAAEIDIPLAQPHTDPCSRSGLGTEADHYQVRPHFGPGSYIQY